MIIALLVMVALAGAACSVVVTIIGVAVTWANRHAFSERALYSSLLPGIALFTITSGAAGWGRSIFGDDTHVAAPNVPLLVTLVALSIGGIGYYLWRVPAPARGAVAASLAVLLVGFFLLSAVVWNSAYIQYIIDTTCQTAPADCG